jgi:predicted metal-dependent hydrolase
LDKFLLFKLLNNQQFYNLHDHLEEHWNTLEEGPVKLKVQALIQLVVALHHEQKGNQKGFKILAQKAFSKLRMPLNLSKIQILNLIKALIGELA